MNDVVDSIDSRNRQARLAALAGLEQLQADPTGLVVYRSKGRLAIVGDALAMEIAPRFQGILQPLVLLTAGVEEPGATVIALGGRSLSVQGYLGAFILQLGDPGRPNSERLEVDLVLDLSPTPLLDLPLTPPGYVHARTDDQSLDSAIETLAALKGTFEKPRYFEYNSAICAHGRSGIKACTRCIKAGKVLKR